MPRRISILVVLAAMAAALLPAQVAPPFAIRVQQGTTVQNIADGGTLGLPSEGIGLPSDGTIQATFTGVGVGATINITGVDLTGSTDFRILGMPDLSLGPLVLTPVSPSFNINVRYVPSTSRLSTARVTVRYLDSNNRAGSFSVNLLGTAAELGFTYQVQPNGNTTLLNQGDVVQFPATNIDETASALVIITNRGTAPGTVNTITYTGSDRFALAGLPFPPATVDAGKDVRFSIRFTPKQLEAVTGGVKIELVAGRSISFGVSGSGLGPVFTYDLVDRGGAAAVPGQVIALPEALVGGEKTTTTVRIRNSGNAEGRITTLTVAGNGFSLLEGPFLPLSLLPGGSATFKLQFSPTQPGRSSGRLRVGNDNFDLEANALGATLSYAYSAGGGTVPVQSGGSVVFPPAPFGETTRVQFALKNEGTAPTDVTSINVSGPANTFALADLPRLPMRVAPGATVPFTVAFTPASVGNVSGSLRIDTQTFTLSGVGGSPEALPAYSFQGSSGTVQPAQQPAVGLSLTSAYPIAVNGTLTLAFNSDVFAPDPAVQFATGGRSVSFTIPAGQKEAVFPNNANQIRIQTGTVAGTISITPSFATAAGNIDLTPANPSAQTLTIAQAAPQLLNVVVSSKTSNGFTLLLTGFATGRSITQMEFQFTPVSGETVSTTRLSLNVESNFTAWYQSQASQAFGSLFTATVPFTLQGDVKNVSNVVDTVQSVSVTLTNRQGASSARSVELK